MTTTPASVRVARGVRAKRFTAISRAAVSPAA
jgi:hypothetical protein